MDIAGLEIKLFLSDCTWFYVCVLLYKGKKYSPFPGSVVLVAIHLTVFCAHPAYTDSRSVRGQSTISCVVLTTQNILILSCTTLLYSERGCALLSL